MPRHTLTAAAWMLLLCAAPTGLVLAAPGPTLASQATQVRGAEFTVEQLTHIVLEHNPALRAARSSLDGAPPIALVRDRKPHRSYRDSRGHSRLRREARPPPKRSSKLLNIS